MMSGEELREKSRTLIGQLIRGQRVVERSTNEVRTLTRELNALQSKLDRLDIMASPSYSANAVSAPLASDSRSSLNLAKANINNNNITHLRGKSRWTDDIKDRHWLDMETVANEMEGSPNEYQEKAGATNSPGFSDEDVKAVQVVRRSPEENKMVRRKLAEEMVSDSPGRSPPTKDEPEVTELCNSIPSSPHPTSALRNVTNTYHTPAADRTTKSAFETPKSILKYRKLIDGNVQVESKFAHTPGWMDRAKRTRTRARDVDKEKMALKPEKRCSKSTNRRLPSVNKTEIEELKGVSFLSASDLPKDEISWLRSKSGNMRSRSDEGHFSDHEEEVTRDTMPTPTSLSKMRGSPDLTPTGNVMKQRMMGYDWIAALLDQSNASDVADKHESYFRELKEFRRIHSDECKNDITSRHDASGYAHLSLVDTDNIKSAIPEAVSPNHTCIHSYTVNPRLYAVPVNSDKAGASRCAVCHKKKHLPSASSPGFVRVSIPRCTLSSPYRIKPHRRKSFDPSDSVALSKHCLKGWVHQRPLKLPMGRNVDLANETNRLKSKFTMTMAEAEDLARKTKASIPVSTRDLDQTTLYNREVKKVTNQLLDMSHSMQFQSQLLTKTPIH